MFIRRLAVVTHVTGNTLVVFVVLKVRLSHQFVIQALRTTFGKTNLACVIELFVMRLVIRLIVHLLQVTTWEWTETIRVLSGNGLFSCHFTAWKYASLLILDMLSNA